MTDTTIEVEQPEPPPYLIPHNPAPVTVIHEDAHLLLIHKPDLLLSVPGRHPANRDCMITRLQRRYPDALVVHRLDLDTSGSWWLPGASRPRRIYHGCFRSGRYTSVMLRGCTGWSHGIRAASTCPSRGTGPTVRAKRFAPQAGRHALTHYRVLQRRDNATYLELEPVTGRSHQLRIHCRELGHPILGCDLYAPPAVLGAAPRLLLHASRVALPHPHTGREIVGHCAPRFPAPWRA